MKRNIMFVFGTRPEVIKLAPVILEFRKYPEDYNVILCNTEQQKELSNQTLSYFGLEADINLNVMKENQTLTGVQTVIMEKLQKVYDTHEIHGTIVQGDTMSVLCGALVSFYNRIPVFHVEAGLRSYDLKEPFPEEAIRQIVARVASLNFAPTEESCKMLHEEALESKTIREVGNTVIDALFCLPEEVVDAAGKFYEQRNIPIDDKLVLITVHRRENHGERLDNIIDAIAFLADEFSDHTFVIPVHPNPNVKDKIYSLLGAFDNIHLLAPLEYPRLVYLMKHAKLILTDSGGIQEEAPSFGCPTIVMRYETERMESVDAGISKLVGADPERIVEASAAVLSKHKQRTRFNIKENPYGDGHSSERIEKLIRKFFHKQYFKGLQKDLY